MDKILNELPLSRAIKLALIDAKGRLAGYIALVRSYERDSGTVFPVWPQP